MTDDKVSAPAGSGGGEAALGVRTSTTTVGALPTPAVPRNRLAPGSDVAGRYVVREVLGSGGYGIVYRVEDRRLDREVALKLFDPQRLDAVALARVRREVALARSFASPRLVRVFDLGESAGHLFVTMEVVVGESLAALLDREAPLAIEQALALADEILLALIDLHAHEVVHRDLKPANVLVEDGNAVKLVDFGLARLFDEEPRQTAGGVVGTVAYCFPDVASGGRLTPAADLYSFGVLLFEMLTGRLPFAGDKLALLRAHMVERPPRVRELRPEVPPWLDGIVDRLLAKRPEDRYASAVEARKHLLRRRGPRRLASLLAGLALLVAAAVGLVWVDVSRSRDPELADVILDPQRGDLRAVGDDGTLLWSRRDVDGSVQIARIEPRAGRDVVGVLGPRVEGPAVSGRELSIWDGESGVLVRRERLPDIPGAFTTMGFSPTYAPVLKAVDIDGDNLDEVFVDSLHLTLYPSFSVLYEPRFLRSRVVFEASGHHRLAAIADLNGDARNDGLWIGINNRLGYRAAVAAVDLSHTIGSPRSPGGAGMAARTPDRSDVIESSLAWYAMLPLRACTDPRCVVVDDAGRRIRVQANLGQDVELSFDGFDLGVSSPRPPGSRAVARRDAYRHVAETLRLAALGRAGAAAGLVALEAARRSAQEAGDAELSDWIAAQRAETLVGVEPSAAIAAFRKLSDGLDDPGSRRELAFRAGVALLMVGRPSDAAAFLRDGLGEGPLGGGHPPRDILELLVLALVELGDSEGVTRAVETFERLNPTDSGRIFLAYRDWRMGLRPAVVDRSGPTDPDLFRYWTLELRRLHPHDPEQLIADVRRDLAVTTECQGLLRSLEAVLLMDLRRPAEARRASVSALDWVAENESRSVAARTHADLVRQRAARLSPRK